jgi:prepilin-type N-terminal cleavage/methylation domain-containing protein
MLHFLYHYKSLRPKGFSLIELLVSMSLIIIITSIVLVNQSRFGGNILVGNLAYDVALSIRQAQVFGLSVREFGAGTSQFDVGYGVHFDATTPTSYRMFGDLNKNKIYDVSDGTQELFNLNNGYRISLICATASGGEEICSDTGSVTVLDIDFIRPDPDAHIRVDASTGTVYQQARIVVISPGGTTREVVVESTGQISISQP